MKINQISFTFPKINKKQNELATKPSITFQGDSETGNKGKQLAALIGVPIVLTSGLVACSQTKEEANPMNIKNWDGQRASSTQINTISGNKYISFWLQPGYVSNRAPRTWHDSGTIIPTPGLPQSAYIPLLN